MVYGINTSVFSILKSFIAFSMLNSLMVAMVTEDVNNGAVRYVLSNESSAAVSDLFVFDLKDRKPNIVPGNIFHIQWSYVLFEQPHFNVTEEAGIIRIPVKRVGNLKQVGPCTGTSWWGRGLN